MAVVEISVGWAFPAEKGPQFFFGDTILITYAVVIDAGAFNEC